MTRLVPADICECWEEIRPTLQVMLDRSAEEIYSACVRCEAVLLRAPEGFIIVSEQFGHDNKKELFVWAVAGHGGQCIRRHWPELADMARALGCTSVVGRVKEDRVSELLERSGWKIRHTEYARTV